MATIDIRRAHRDDRDTAATKMRSLLDKFAATKPELVKGVHWTPSGYSATMTGKGFKGTFDVTPSEVTVAIDLKFIARPFKRRIETELTQQLSDMFRS